MYLISNFNLVLCLSFLVYPKRFVSSIKAFLYESYKSTIYCTLSKFNDSIYIYKGIGEEIHIIIVVTLWRFIANSCIKKISVIKI